MTKKLTTEEFIVKATRIHGDTYDYSKVEYINTNTKVIIICKKHGEFQQTPNNHLTGFGCKKCSIEYVSNLKKYTLNDFIINAKQIHGEKYDYSMVDYINNKTKITIICKEHGEFLQVPTNHISGAGCNKCNGGVKHDLIDFIEKAKQIHGDKYDYSKVNYINCKTKITIICKEHGEFEQEPGSHISGSGCNFCGIESRKQMRTKTTQQFINEAKEIHGDKYDYSKVNYETAKEHIIIICKEHGEFEQTPDSHIGGTSCPRCAKQCFSKSQILWLDFISNHYNIQIQHAENEKEYQIPSTRYKADGYCQETNTVYEFHGDYWHGNPKLFKEDSINKTTNKSFGELYQNTLQREQLIKDLGYNLVVMWEYDWNKINNSIKTLQQKFRNSKQN